MRRRRCLESGRPTGLDAAPSRRVRCIVCGALIKLQDNGERIVVPIHYVPEARWLVRAVLPNMTKVYEGTDQ